MYDVFSDSHFQSTVVQEYWKDFVDTQYYVTLIQEFWKDFFLSLLSRKPN